MAEEKQHFLKVILGLLKPVKGKMVFNNELLNGNRIRISSSDVNRRYKLSGYSNRYYSLGTDDRKRIISRMTSADRKKAAECNR